MSLLWSKTIRKVQSIRKKKPSPTCQSYIADSARNPQSSLKGCRRRPFILSRFIEGTPLSAIFSGTVKAGMTVEAAVVLPLFLFFFLNLGGAIEMIRLHGNLQLALWQAGSKLSVYGYAVDSGEKPQSAETENEWWKELTGIAFSSTFVKRQIINSAGKNYLDRSPLAGGAEGLQLWESRIFGAGDEVSIVVTYGVSPWSSLMGFGSFRMANRYYSHIWNGYELSAAGGGGNEADGRKVYVTETGAVYHLNRDCTYLKLSVRTISALKIGEARNRNGGKYYGCSKCARGTKPDVYYITDEGDRYHYDRDCSGLKRTVRVMGMDHAVRAGYTPCSRCGR